MMNIFNAWVFVAVTVILLSSCRSNSHSTSPAPSRSSAPKYQPPPREDRCEQECREEECDYEEAGEEAMIHVIEIDSSDDTSSTLTKEISPAASDAPNEPLTSTPTRSEEMDKGL